MVCGGGGSRQVYQLGHVRGRAAGRSVRSYEGGQQVDQLGHMRGGGGQHACCKSGCTHSNVVLLCVFVIIIMASGECLATHPIYPSPPLRRPPPLHSFTHLALYPTHPAPPWPCTPLPSPPLHPPCSPPHTHLALDPPTHTQACPHLSLYPPARVLVPPTPRHAPTHLPLYPPARVLVVAKAGE